MITTKSPLHDLIGDVFEAAGEMIVDNALGRKGRRRSIGARIAEKFERRGRQFIRDMNEHVERAKKAAEDAKTAANAAAEAMNARKRVIEDAYRFLGVSKASTDEEITKAYRTKAKVLHPDTGGSNEEFKKLAQAYGIVQEDRRR